MFENGASPEEIQASQEERWNCYRLFNIPNEEEPVGDCDALSQIELPIMKTQKIPSDRLFNASSSD